MHHIFLFNVIACLTCVISGSSENSLSKNEDDNGTKHKPVIDCSNGHNSLNLSILSTEVNDLAITFTYELAVLNQPPEIDASHYVTECLRSIIFRYDVEETQEYNTYEQVIHADAGGTMNLGNLVTKFELLRSLSTYTFQIGYGHKDNTGTYVIIDLVLRTCLGTPGPPHKIQTTKNQNHSVLVEWSEPPELNAPALCYYSVKIGNKKSNWTNEIETVESSFLIGADLLRKGDVMFSVKTVNDPTCFNISSSADFEGQCANQTMESKTYYNTFKAISSSNSNSSAGDYVLKFSNNTQTSVILAITMICYFML